ncbi:hypothetical protein A11A3_01997 [Alcanivorax hongdengensis A-11-3]|uniref:Polysaccharide biosynthesis protein n=1 Tax=Alcanivorax hongdengensis A-11-3 TaxID=1177179 RepID=L0WFW1_9GAMM|nr:hypothetical protein [Alcanivorax hongdengensis]EKF75604.1 hypothetical protein A11A3_01997 [Alcanivorax hongdengensis A-11-3]
MSELKLLIYALAVEATAMLVLLSEHKSLIAFTLYLSSHGLASVLLALGAWRLMPLRFRRPPLWSWLLIFGFAFFIPAIGLLTILGGLLVGILLPAVFRDQPFGLVDKPYFAPVSVTTGSSFRQVDLKSLLSGKNVPNALRVQGMLVLKDMPPRITGRLLRATLGDEFEDLRLLAYGILDQKEKEITRQIDRLLQMLERARESRRYRLSRRLAELYWELNYQDLVRGDIRDLTLERAAFYGDMALMESPDDAGMWLLRGRIQLAQEDYGQAHQSLTFARRLGLSSAQVNPWLAEIALERRQLPLVRRLMQEINEESQFTTLNRAVQYWRDHEPAASA